MTIELNRIYNEDCLVGMRKIADRSVDLTVTSPPYDNLRKYNGYAFDFESVARELYRITKPGGVIVWVVGDATVNGSETLTSFKQALFFKEIGFNVHDTMIYEKENPVPLTHNRYEQKFEYMFVFSKGRPTVFNPIMEATSRPGESRRGYSKPREQTTEASRTRTDTIITKSERRRFNIWRYAVGRGGSTRDSVAFQHPAIFPERLAYDHIISWSNRGDVVFDPFMGSGTTAKMSIISGRQYLGFEVSEEYVGIARQRLAALTPVDTAA
ncbi:site-specific DNA-methyltransferase [Paenibacillus sp. 7124]|uniref:Methyltransferase n=1 Tax=Paenibacillus apii TaxID=1850370 RepID=A0A6M1PG64_9BACL|nr:site-specific DNA-methyltransferase [Paenibacillus apii]NGM81235.1 site-specific DNA-methyltransferase [Paenibacillus apii]